MTSSTSAQRGLGAIPAGAPDQKHLQIGGTWDLKFVKLHAGYAKEDNVYVTSAHRRSTLTSGR